MYKTGFSLLPASRLPPNLHEFELFVWGTVHIAHALNSVGNLEVGPTLNYGLGFMNVPV